MTSIDKAASWIGRTAVDNTGQQIGQITQIWVDDASGDAEWVSLKIIGRPDQEALVPLAGAAPFGGGRRFAYSKADIVDAPLCAQDGSLSVADKEELSSYYGAPDTESGSATWISRMDDASDGKTVQEIRDLLGPDHSAPAPRAATTGKGRRFGRKSSPSTH
jgi:hypothetical protein